MYQAGTHLCLHIKTENFIFLECHNCSDDLLGLLVHVISEEWLILGITTCMYYVS